MIESRDLFEKCSYPFIIAVIAIEFVKAINNEANFERLNYLAAQSSERFLQLGEVPFSTQQRC
jgi:hypothetical protein